MTQVGLIHEKNEGRKSRESVPLNGDHLRPKAFLLYAYSIWQTFFVTVSI
jgi:hypothetical protein